MNTKMNMSLRNVQEQAEDSVKQASQWSRKAFYIYAGMWGMAYDNTKMLWDKSMNLVDNAEHRGEEVMQDFTKRVENMREQANHQFMQWRGDVEQRVHDVEQRVHDAGVELTENVKNVERRAEQVMERLGLNGELVAVKPVTIEIVETVVEKPVLVEPFAGYDEMTAKEVVEKLGPLGEDVLAIVREYEAAHKNRVTVLDAINERLAHMDAVMA
ncbi:MAG: hypothetical protein U0350_50860 [Caldilineaceae bacterium]